MKRKHTATVNYACGFQPTAATQDDVETHLRSCEVCRQHEDFTRKFYMYFKATAEARKRLMGSASGRTDSGGTPDSDAESVLTERQVRRLNRIRESGVLELRSDRFIEALADLISNDLWLEKLELNTPPSTPEFRAIPAHWRKFSAQRWSREFRKLDAMESRLLAKRVEDRGLLRSLHRLREMRDHRQRSAVYMLEYQRRALENVLYTVVELLRVKHRMLREKGEVEDRWPVTVEPVPVQREELLAPMEKGEEKWYQKHGRGMDTEPSIVVEKDNQWKPTDLDLIFFSTRSVPMKTARLFSPLASGEVTRFYKIGMGMDKPPQFMMIVQGTRAQMAAIPKRTSDKYKGMDPRMPEWQLDLILRMAEIRKRKELEQPKNKK